MKQDLLKQYLVQLALKSDNTQLSQLKSNVFKALYYAASDDGRFLESLLPNISQVELMDLDDYQFSLNWDISRLSHDSASASAGYTHAKHTACARPFEKGEPVYRCEECGFDSTCVLCVHCFNEQDHLGHNVQMYISRDNTGGICDCGDPEAFVDTLNCKCQLVQDASDDLHTDFSRAIKTTLRVVLDYILDVSNFSVSTLPFIHNNLNKAHSPLNTEALSHLSNLPLYKYGMEDVNSDDWHLVLWNDEYHNFVEATAAITAGCGADHNEAHNIASHVNTDGRAIIRTAKSPFDLLIPLDKVEDGGLVATIMSSRDFMREEIIDCMFQWLEQILHFDSHAIFKEFVRSEFANLLLEPGYAFPKKFPTSLMEGLSIDVERRCYENGILYNGEIVNYGLTQVNDNFTTKDLLKPVHQVLEHPKISFRNSRLQFLLLFSLRFKLSVRKILLNVVIPPLLGDLNLKIRFGEHYIQIYPQLMASLALADREEHLNITSHISSQMLTFPTFIQNVLKNNHAGYILGPLSQLIEEHSGVWNYDTGYPNFYQNVTEPSHKNKALNEAIFRGLHDVGYLAEPLLASGHLAKLMEKSNLAMLILLLRNFQGYWPVERKYGDHVEVEILDFVIHLRYSVPILKITKQAAESDPGNYELVKSAAKLIMNFLFQRKIPHKSVGVADFTVSKEPVSFVHPINSYLSYLMQSNDFSLFIDIIKQANQPFMHISDISLRSIVLGAQVKIGFWIRNGISVSRQASLYVDSIMADSAFRRDMHLNQIAMLFDDPRSTLYNFLDRWELCDWFAGDLPADGTIYEDRFEAIAEKFIIFVYNLLVDRSAFTKMTKTERLAYIAKQLICYSLSDGPRSYSDIKDIMDPEIIDQPEFDDWLSECATYQSPSSLVDSGMYRLKSHCFDKLDPYSMYLDSSQAQEVADAIKSHLSKTTRTKEDKVILTPNFVHTDNEFVTKHLGEFTKTNFFAKLLYKLLQVAINNEDETYLAPLLHLIHAILIDDEIVHGEDYISIAFVNIPISDLLLTISQSSMSKHLVIKAEYLLNIFISRDDKVIDSLIDCFGKEHIDEYMKLKTGSLESDSDKRKRLASQRTAKVMEKFAKQRKKFLAKNTDFEADDSSKDGVPETSRNCVLCGEPETTDDIFGILGSISSPSILWKIPPGDSEFLDSAMIKYTDEIPRSEDRVYGKGFDYSHNRQTSTTSKDERGQYDAFVGATCSHGMHYSCYRRSGGRTNFFSCPLCHTIQNIIVPSYLPPKNGGGLPLEKLNSDFLYPRYEQIINSVGEDKNKDLIQHLFNEKMTELSMVALRRNLLVFSDDFNNKLKGKVFLEGQTVEIKYFNLLQSVSTLIADTVRMNEIVTRLNGEQGYTDFIQAVPDSAKTLVKSLIQCRALLYELREMPNLLGTNSDLEDQVQAFWFYNSELVTDPFTEFVMLFFQTDESFTALAYSCYVRLFVTSAFAFGEKHLQEQPPKGLDIDDFRYDRETTTALASVFNSDYVKDVRLKYYQDRKWAQVVLAAVEKMMIPYLKQILIFKDILTSKNGGDNSHTSIDEIEDLPDKIRSQSRIDSIDALLDNLSLPSFKEVLLRLTNRESFESSVFAYWMQSRSVLSMVGREPEIKALDYPGMIKLIDMPKDYMECLLDYNGKSKKGAYDNYVCLHCGNKVSISKYFKHMKRCCHDTCIFYHPAKNNFKVVTYIGQGPVSLVLPGPYLTSHGEVKNPTGPGKGILNDYRYKEMTKQWLDQSLHGFITRTLYGSRQNNFNPLNNFTFTPGMGMGMGMGTGTALDESSEEEEDFLYSPW